MLGIITMKKAQKRQVVKMRAVAAIDSSILEMPVPWDNHQEQHQWRTGASQSLKDKLCVLQRMELKKDGVPLEEPRISLVSLSY